MSTSMSSKTISVSHDLLGGYFKPKRGGGGEHRGTRRLRPIPKQQILNELRAAQESILRDTRRADNQDFKPYLEDKPDAFEASRNFLNQKIAPPLAPKSVAPSPSPSSSPFPSPSHQFIKPSAPLQSAQIPTLHLPPTSYKMVPTPTYGCLKHGVLPTYRAWKNIKEMSPQPPVLLQSPLQPNKTPQEEKLMISNAEKLAAAVVSPVPVPVQAPAQTQKNVYRRTYKVGMKQKENKVSVLISNNDQRKTLKRKQCEVKELSTTQLREKLAKQGIVRTTTTAPRHLLQNIYENSCVNLCGELKVKES